MLLALLAVFFAFPGRLYHVIGFNRFANPVWSNVWAVLMRSTTWFYSVLACCFGICIYLTRGRTDDLSAQLHRYARVALTFLCVLVVFDVINFYIAVFNPYDHDPLLRHMDVRLFGTSPSEWFDGITCWPLTLLFCGAYASWFFMTYFSVFIMARHSERAMHEYVTAAIFAFYIGYATYFFVPAIGPEFTMHYERSIGPLLKLVDGQGPFLSRDCFPSLHTGLSIVMLVNAWRHARKIFWIYLLDVSLIILSTMYLRVHYGVDVVAGAALAVAVCQMAPVAISFWTQLRNREWTTTSHGLGVRHPVGSQDNASEWA